MQIAHRFYFEKARRAFFLFQNPHTHTHTNLQFIKIRSRSNNIHIQQVATTMTFRKTVKSLTNSFKLNRLGSNKIGDENDDGFGPSVRIIRD